jgi:hypothetical protein
VDRHENRDEQELERMPKKFRAANLTCLGISKVNKFTGIPRVKKFPEC